MEWIKLIGILIILIGFILKFDTLAVVLVAALATALVSDISFVDFLTLLGDAFVDNRLVTLFLLTLPMIGLSDRFGMRQRSVHLIEKIKGLTAGRFLTLYLFIREIAGFFGIRIQGQTQFVAPLVNPMTQAAIETKYGKISKEDEDKVKARAAATENFGNFFAQNTFIAASGVLLIASTMSNLGYEVSTVAVAQASIPIAFIIFVIVTISNALFDRKMTRKYSKQNVVQEEDMK